MELLSFFKSLFGLADGATEQDAINSVQKLQASNETLKKEKEALQARFDKQEQDKKAAQLAEVKSLLDAALLDGRLDATTRPVYETLFASDYQATKTALAAIPKRKPISTQVGSSTSNVSQFDKSWEELDKAGLLASLHDQDFELYKEKFKAKFGNYPNQ